MKVYGMGRLVRDPEVNATGNTKYARFSIACDRRFKRDGQPDADFFNCISFGKQADFVEKYLKKGTKIMITGRVEINSYTNREGQKVNTPQITCEEIEFAESKAAQNTSRKTPENDYVSIPDNAGDELPFV